MNENVVALEKHRERPPAPAVREFWFDDETCNLQVTVRDSGGRTFVVSYAIKSQTPKEERDLIRAAWSALRQESSVAS